MNKNWLAPAPTPRKKAKPPAPAPPEAPSWLSDAARALWDEHSATWHELGALGRLDVHACALLCEELAAFNRHRDAVLAEGAVVERPHYSGVNPEAKLRDDAAKRITLLLRQAGLTRASRAGTAMMEEPTRATPASQLMDRWEGGFATD